MNFLLGFKRLGRPSPRLSPPRVTRASLAVGLAGLSQVIQPEEAGGKSKDRRETLRICSVPINYAPSPTRPADQNRGSVWSASLVNLSSRLPAPSSVIGDSLVRRSPQSENKEKDPARRGVEVSGTFVPSAVTKLPCTLGRLTLMIK